MSNEVAVFVDDNQFGAGQSTMKCGPEAVAVFWHSVANGQSNPWKAADIHAMASADYEQFIGPDTPDDGNGTSNEVLYAMLDKHLFHYAEINGSLAVIKAFLRFGYSVILGITEDSVFDLDLNGSPYNWDPAGRSHIVLATGAGDPGELLIRDTANIDGNGNVRPGPRRYRGDLALLSATVVIPSWMSNPFIG